MGDEATASLPSSGDQHILPGHLHVEVPRVHPGQISLDLESPIGSADLEFGLERKLPFGVKPVVHLSEG
jgi:hypothetical protein